MHCLRKNDTVTHTECVQTIINTQHRSDIMQCRQCKNGLTLMATVHSGYAQQLIEIEKETAMQQETSLTTISLKTLGQVTGIEYKRLWGVVDRLKKGKIAKSDVEKHVMTALTSRGLSLQDIKSNTISAPVAKEYKDLDTDINTVVTIAKKQEPCLYSTIQAIQRQLPVGCALHINGQ